MTTHAVSPTTTPQASPTASALNPGTKPSAAAVRHDEPALLPPVDVIEDPHGITLYADLPGVPKDKLQLQVDGDTLSIDAELALPVPQAMEASHAEVRRSRYHRAFSLSRELDPAKVSAELSHGVLRVRIPKAEHAQARRITVQVG